MLHQLQQVVEPQLKLKKTFLIWDEIAFRLAESPRARCPQTENDFTFKTS